jgi:dipeptidyl aminopeptidase/acylaminoacyl peptidase
MSVPEKVRRRALCSRSKWLGCSAPSHVDSTAVRLVVTRVLLASASAVVLLLAAFAGGVSSAGSGGAAAAVRNGRVTIINQRRPPPERKAGIVTVDGSGGLHLLKRCDAGTGWRGCYSLQSVDWAPDGRRLAFSVTTISRITPYNGIHVLDTFTGADRHLPRDGFDIDWSPDGSRFAYVEYVRFPSPLGSIYFVRPDGSGRTLVRTRTAGRDASPSWSPGGKRLAYETNATGGYSVRLRDRSVWVVGVDGKDRHLVARNAADPAWSPNGRMIAYRASCGIKLVTPAGRDVTPPTGARRCRAIGVAGQPVWSPDGRKIAIGNRRGVYVMNADGSNLAWLTSANPTGMFGFSRPTWQPLPH